MKGVARKDRCFAWPHRNDGHNSLASPRWNAPRRSILSLSLAALLTPLAHAQVIIPSSTATVNLSALGPAGSSIFIAPTSTIVNVNGNSAVAGDASQNWNLTNYGTLQATSFWPTVLLNSLSAGGVLLDNHGKIEGLDPTTGGGVQLNNSGTVINRVGAQITSAGFYGITAGTAGTNISNSGTISGYSSGIRMAGGTFTQTQSGVLSGPNGAGLLNDGGQLAVDNAGLMTGGGWGIFLRGTTTGTVINSGSIVGPVGVLLQTSGVALTNTGTINGSDGTAISIVGNNNTVTLGSGSVLIGNAIVTSGTGNKLVLQGSGSEDSNLTGFSDLTMSGTNWLLSGTTTTVGASSAATSIQSGVLTVTGTLANTGAGAGTTISSGATLQLGSGGTSGSVTGNIVNGGVLGFNRSDVVNFSNVISGTGAVNQIGTGTTVLTGANTYTGGTTISAGTLQLGNGGTSGSIAGDVTNSGVLVFNRSDTFVVPGAVSGTGPVNQVGTGTTILAGTNTYTGGTTISAGTLQIGDGGTTGSIAGNIVNNSRLAFNRSDSLVYDSVISGTGSVAQVGPGKVLFNGVQTYTGPTDVAAGTLAIGDALHTGAQLAGGGLVTVGENGSLGGYGQVSGSVVNYGFIGVGNALPALANGPDAIFTINGNLDNHGTISMANGTAGDRMIVTGGTYTSNGGILKLDTVLNEGGLNSLTDRLVTDATAVGAGGATKIVVQTVAGDGAATLLNGIRVVEVGDPSRSASGAFSLSGRAVSGLYEYQLYQGGRIDPQDGQWYLRSEQPEPPIPPIPPIPPTPPTPRPVPAKLLRPEAGAYLANQHAAQTMFVTTMHDRLGDPRFGEDSAANGNAKPAAGWARVVGSRTESNAAGGQLDMTTRGEVLQAGGDVARWSPMQRGDSLRLGVMTAWGSMRTDASAQGNPFKASGTVDGYALGVYATWFANAQDRLGTYVDGWTQYGNFDNKVKGDLLPSEKYSSHSWTSSLEMGYGFKPFGSDWVLEPQGQIIYTDYSAGGHREVNQTDVSNASSGGLTTRVGARVYRDFVIKDGSVLQASFEANWLYSNRQNRIAMGDETVTLDGIPKNTGEIKGGLHYQFARQWQTWGNVGWGFGASDYRRLIGMAGVRYTW